jgi:hypothetical protein
MGASFQPISDIFLAKVNMANIDYSSGKRTEVVADFRYRGPYWDCFIFGIFVAKVTMETTACCGIISLRVYYSFIVYVRWGPRQL